MNVNDLTFEPKAPKAAVDFAVNWLDGNKAIFGAATAFTVVDDEAKRPMTRTAGQCHAGIQDINKLPVNGTRAVVGTEIATFRNLRREGVPASYERAWTKNNEEFYPYLKWLTQDSPYSRFILNKDDWDFITTNGIIVSADIPSPLLQNIMIMSRHVRECYVTSFRMFNRMIEKYPKAGMFLYNVCFCSSISTTLPDQDKFVYSVAAHRTHPLFPTLEELNNFCAGEFGSKLTNDSAAHYRNHATIFGGASYARKLSPNGALLTDSGSTFVHELVLKDKEFKKELRSLRGVTDEAPKITNPFARPTYANRPPDSPAICKQSEFEKFIIPYIIEKGLLPSVL